LLSAIAYFLQEKSYLFEAFFSFAVGENFFSLDHVKNPYLTINFYLIKNQNHLIAIFSLRCHYQYIVNDQYCVTY